MYTDIEEYLRSEKKVSKDDIAQMTQMLPLFECDVVAYENMKATSWTRTLTFKPLQCR